MSITLLPPVFNQMPLFQANQVLTYGHLNDMANYLYQQERYTRSKLIGSGIVCGLSYRWVPQGAMAEVWIDEGIGITSAGYLLVFQQPVKDGVTIGYKHRRNFNRLNDFIPFNSVVVAGNQPIYELITQTEFDEEQLLVKATLQDADRNARVLVLLFDPEMNNVAKCLDEGCDDKGKIIKYRIRPLLIPQAIMDGVTNLAPAGRSWKGAQSIRQDLDYIKLPPLLSGIGLGTLNSPIAFSNVFANLLTNSFLNGMSQKMQALFTAFPWLFNPAFDCLKGEINELNAQTIGALFVGRATAFRNNIANRAHFQYLYDYARDVAQAYNELFDAVSDLTGECGGDEGLYPFHISLGIPQTNETLACMKEQRFSEPHHRYSSHFTPSPIVAGQWQLYEKVIFLYKRLARMVSDFQVDVAPGVQMKITPSRDYDTLLGDRAIPFYYRNPAANPVVAVWNEKLTRRNKLSHIKGYQLLTQAQLLDGDFSANDFFRIEGMTGKPFDSALTTINDLRALHHLPIRVAAVPLNPVPAALTACSWPDLQEDYGYYRDRVIGFLKEIMAWWPGLQKSLGKMLGNDQEFISELLKKLMGILKEVHCIEHFPYAEWKKIYAEFWRILFEAYARQQEADGSTVGAFHFFNSLLNVVNLWLFAPIYKIWFALLHRQMVLQATSQKSLSQNAGEFVGLEHLAGVRRGHTFLMVYNELNGQVIGDFSIPAMGDCDCGCKAQPCDGKQRVSVAPLEKPVLMVVMPFASERYLAKNPDAAYAISRIVAVYNEKDDQYELHLDEMGFYKAGSHIEPEVEVLNDAGVKPAFVKAIWEDDRLSIFCKLPKKEKELKGGVHLLNYSLKGDFDQQLVKGRLIIIIAGVLERVVDDKNRNPLYAAEVGASGAVPYYPYDNTSQPTRKYKVDVEYDTQLTNIGNERVRVFNTPTGNQVGIFVDDKGNDYLKLIKAAQPGVEEIPFVLKSGTDTVKSNFSLNIVNPKEKLDSDKIAGTVLDDKGTPVVNARVVASSGKEVLTNEKGEYLLEGVKAGEIIKVESRDFATVQVQATKKMETEIKLQPSTTNVLNVMEKMEVPSALKEITKGFNLGGIDKAKLK